jgi:hypothetical protein
MKICPTNKDGVLFLKKNTDKHTLSHSSSSRNRARAFGTHYKTHKVEEDGDFDARCCSQGERSGTKGRQIKDERHKRYNLCFGLVAEYWNKANSERE